MKNRQSEVIIDNDSQKVVDLNINNLNSWTEGLFTNNFDFSKFFWFTFYFCFKTLITLVWNYLSLKLFMY